MKTFLGISLILAAIAVLPAQSPLWADSSDSGTMLSFCSFGPKVSVLFPHSDSAKGCAERSHVQAVNWKCDLPSRTAEDRANFLAELNRLAREECSARCESRGSDCRGVYTQQPVCALGSSSSAEALKAGKVMGCRHDCEDGGQAFVYCSLFNAGFSGEGKDAVRGTPFNCECRPE